MKYRWGIVGIGDIAERGMAPALNRATDTALVSIFSRSLAKAKQFASKHNAAKAYDSVEQNGPTRRRFQ
ncbi:MAG: Gfo/Idh/MocA family oxidoreductase [Betaproteobacteria bacterium]|nr:Gfo/Idh/MocA family oxidoreductase [Betaproteobacteria bacterium]